MEDEVIQRAREMDLLTYLQRCEPDELVHLSGNTYTTKTHDSLKISNGKWMWWSRGIGGYNALDYLIKVREIPFREAVEAIAGNTDLRCPHVKKCQAPRPKLLLLPEKSETNNVITEYLFGRGIDLEIIDECITRGIIFESLPYHNVVFVGRDKDEKPRYAAYRATDDSRIMGDASGSDKHFSFRLSGSTGSTVHLFESAIDALSYATLLKMECKDWRSYNLLSLAGVYAPKQNGKPYKPPAALQQFIKENTGIRCVVLHLDNDSAGRLATEAIVRCLREKFEVVDEPPQMGKDVNDFLRFELGIYRPAERNPER